MEMIAELDSRMDKKAVQKHDDLKNKYDIISNRIVNYFKNKDNINEDNYKILYNTLAINQAKNAKILYKRFNTKFNKGDADLKRLSKKLGGWETHKLLPSTNTYVMLVYSEIFQKLKDEKKLEMTKLMIKEPIKNL
ncbi:hypothetical protein ACFL5P_01140 [candidate division KSB1 bacterium]